MLRDEKWEELGKMYSMLQLCDSKVTSGKLPGLYLSVPVLQEENVIEKFAEKLSSYIDKCALVTCD